MAITNVATGATLIKNVVSEKLWREAQKESYFSKFTDASGNSIVHLKKDLTKGKGEKITFGYRPKLVGSGVGEGERLKGKEEKLATYDYSLTLAQKRHAVSAGTAMDQHRAAWDIPMEAEAALKVWASEYIDQLHFTAALASPTYYLYREKTGGTFARGTVAATVKADVSAANSKITPSFLSQIKTWIKTGGDRKIDPLRPVRVEGDEMYVVLVSPDVGYDMRVDTTFAGALKDAEARGPKNPLFKGAVAVWDGLVVHTHENIVNFDNGGGASEHGCFGVVLGAQALMYAVGEPGKLVKEKDDYENEEFIAWGHIGAVGKPTFNSKVYGSVGLCFGASNVSGK